MSKEPTYNEVTLQYLQGAGISGALLQRVEKSLKLSQEFVIVAESLEPEIGSDFEDGNIMKLKKWKADPQVYYQVCASVNAAMKWLDERNTTRFFRSATRWRQSSVGQALPGYEVVGTTGASSLSRTVTYVNEFGEHEHWQQIRVEFVEGVDS